MLLALKAASSRFHYSKRKINKQIIICVFYQSRTNIYIYIYILNIISTNKSGLSIVATIHIAQVLYTSSPPELFCFPGVVALYSETTTRSRSTYGVTSCLNTNKQVSFLRVSIISMETGANLINTFKHTDIESFCSNNTTQF